MERYECSYFVAKVPENAHPSLKTRTHHRAPKGGAVSSNKIDGEAAIETMFRIRVAR